MKNNLEKYIFFYFLYYLAILSVFGFFDYIALCNGDSLRCQFSLNRINKIIITSIAFVTPLIAIFAIYSWKNQKQYEKSDNILKIIILSENDLRYLFKLLCRGVEEYEKNGTYLFFGSNHLDFSFYSKLSREFSIEIDMLDHFSTNNEIKEIYVSYRESYTDIYLELNEPFMHYLDSMKEVREKLNPEGFYSLIDEVNLNNWMHFIRHFDSEKIERVKRKFELHITKKDNLKEKLNDIKHN